MWIRLMGHQTMMVLAADKPPPLVPSFAPENFGRRVVVQYHSCITVSPTFRSFSGGCGYVPLPKLSTLSPLYLHCTIIVVGQNQIFRGPIVQSPLIGKSTPCSSCLILGNLGAVPLSISGPPVSSVIKHGWEIRTKSKINNGKSVYEALFLRLIHHSWLISLQ